VSQTLDHAPSKTIVLRDGVKLEIPTAEVLVGDLLLVRRVSKIPVDSRVLEGESSVDECPVAPSCSNRRRHRRG